jgi:hypothetical protein
MNAGAATEWLAAGRVCPVDYTYAPSVFDRPADLTTDTLYVVGGIYGKLAALDAVERLTAAERGASRVVFNGDYHWFDAEPEWFASVERRVTRHTALCGNVETEIVRPGDIGAGCGCAYPPSVPGDVVARSNEILALLQGAAPAAAGTRFGLVTRIATTASPHPRLYGIERDGVHIDAFALPYDHDAFLSRFQKRWPRGTPAYASYHARIMNGPDYRVAQAAGP